MHLFRGVMKDSNNDNLIPLMKKLEDVKEEARELRVIGDRLWKQKSDLLAEIDRNRDGLATIIRIKQEIKELKEIDKTQPNFGSIFKKNEEFNRKDTDQITMIPKEVTRKPTDREHVHHLRSIYVQNFDLDFLQKVSKTPKTN